MPSKRFNWGVEGIVDWVIVKDCCETSRREREYDCCCATAALFIAQHKSQNIPHLVINSIYASFHSLYTNSAITHTSGRRKLKGVSISENGGSSEVKSRRAEGGKGNGAKREEEKGIRLFQWKTH